MLDSNTSRNKNNDIAHSMSEVHRTKHVTKMDSNNFVVFLHKSNKSNRKRYSLVKKDSEFPPMLINDS